MSDGNALSGDDLAALFDELGNDDPAPVTETVEPQPFAWGADNGRAPTMALPMIDRLNERLVGGVRELVE